jgi:hypothetical protein
MLFKSTLLIQTMYRYQFGNNKLHNYLKLLSLN